MVKPKEKWVTISTNFIYFHEMTNAAFGKVIDRLEGEAKRAGNKRVKWSTQKDGWKIIVQENQAPKD
jgi:hypothetical protein